ncbi:hypothetical protein ACTXGQ_11390 [Marinobacter sp. 1Y8]
MAYAAPQSPAFPLALQAGPGKRSSILRYLVFVTILTFIPMAPLVAQEKDHKVVIKTFDLKMTCLKDIAQHNYLMLYDQELNDGESGYLNREKEDIFGSFLPQLYKLCGCVIEQAVQEHGLAEIESAMEANIFWSEIITQYDSMTGDGSCPQDPIIYTGDQSIDF